MKYIFRLAVSSAFVFLLMSFRAELCKAQVPAGYTVPTSDTTSVPASPTPDNPGDTRPKKHHHKNNDEPTMDTLSTSSTGTNTPDSVVTPKKRVKKKKYIMPDSLQSATKTTNTPDSIVTPKKKAKRKKYRDIVPDSTQTITTSAKDSAANATKDEEQATPPPPDPVYIPLTPEQKASYIVESGNKLQGNGDFKSAIIMFDSVINYYPNTFYYKYAFYYRGQADAMDNRKDESLKDLSTFIALDSCKSPYCSDAHYMRALVYFHQSDFNAAIADFNFVAGHDSTYKNLKFAYFYRAFCYGQQNVYPKAVQDLTRFLFLDNMKTIASADALYNRAFYKIKLNDNRGAIQDYDKAIELYISVIQSSKNAKEEGYIDKLIDTYTQRGLAKADINKFDEAILDYNLALKFNANYAKAYLLRGLAYINQNKTDLGCLDFSKAGELGATEAYDEIKKYCK